MQWKFLTKAVSVIGKMKKSGYLKHDLFIDTCFHLVALHNLCLCKIRNLVNDTGDNVAKESRVAVVHLPLTTYYFDFGCQFL